MVEILILFTMMLLDLVYNTLKVEKILAAIQILSNQNRLDFSYRSLPKHAYDNNALKVFFYKKNNS